MKNQPQIYEQVAELNSLFHKAKVQTSLDVLQMQREIILLKLELEQMTEIIKEKIQ